MNTNQKKLLGVLGGGICAALTGIVLVGRKYDKDGYDKNGYNKNGYDREGYDKKGYNEDGYDKNGYDRYGYNESLYNNEGIDVTRKTYADYIKISEEFKEKQNEIEKYLSEDKLENARFLLQGCMEKFIDCFSQREEIRRARDESRRYRDKYLSSFDKEYRFWTYELSDAELNSVSYMIGILNQKKIGRNQFQFLNENLGKLSSMIEERLKNNS